MSNEIIRSAIWKVRLGHVMMNIRLASEHRSPINIRFFSTNKCLSLNVEFTSNNCRINLLNKSFMTHMILGSTSRALGLPRVGLGSAPLALGLQRVGLSSTPLALGLPRVGLGSTPLSLGGLLKKSFNIYVREKRYKQIICIMWF